MIFDFSEIIRPSRKVDLAGLSVMLAMPSHRDLPPQTVASLLDTQAELIARGVPISIECDYGNSLVHHARTKMAWRFLQSGHNRLFWVDSDIAWQAKDFVRLLAHSVTLDLVGAAYPAKMDPPLFMVRRIPGEMTINAEGCVAMDGIGLGFTCASRSVMEALAAKAPKQRFHQLPDPIPGIFRFGTTEDGAAEGEDMAFFADAKAAGFPLWVDPSITLGHVGQKVYRASLGDYLVPKET